VVDVIVIGAGLSGLRPGRVHGAWSALRAPYGRVHFAGAHTALRWPSFMDGAIESGHRVADEIDPGTPVTWPRTMDHP
jgi:monoamine oxidase